MNAKKLILTSLAAACLYSAYVMPSANALSQASKSFFSLHSQSAASNPRGIRFLLRTENGRTQFYCGERIPVKLIVSSTLNRKYACAVGATRREYDGDGDQFICDPSFGAVDPKSSSYMEVHREGISAALEAIQYLTHSVPAIATMDLNQWIAFDRPGTYRIYACSGRVSRLKWISGQYPPEQLALPKPIVSNIIVLHVVEPDEVWQHKALANSLALGSKGWDGPDWLTPMSYLRTKESLFAFYNLLDRTLKVDYPMDAAFIKAEVGHQIMASPYRDQLVSVIEHDIGDPTWPVTEEDLEVYSELIYYRKHPKRPDNFSQRPDAWYREEFGPVSASVMRALPTKRGKASTTTREALTKFQHESFSGNPLSL